MSECVCRAGGKEGDYRHSDYCPVGKDQRIAELEAELAELKKENDRLQSGSLLRKPGPPPKGCYCKPGNCGAPKPEWCRDAKKRDALLQGEGNEQGIAAKANRQRQI